MDSKEDSVGYNKESVGDDAKRLYSRYVNELNRVNNKGKFYRYDVTIMFINMVIFSYVSNARDVDQGLSDVDQDSVISSLFLNISRNIDFHIDTIKGDNK